MADPSTQLPGGPKTVNEEFLDALLRHQIGLLRLSGGIRNKIFKLLNASEQDIADQIRSRLANHTGLNTPAKVKRLQSLLESIRATRLTSWRQVNKEWLTQLRDLAKSEPTFVDMALKTVSPAVLQTTLPSPSLLRGIVGTRPFRGKTLSGWARDIRRADLNRIEDQIKIGMVQGESSAVIARRVVGTARLRGRDGVTEITRRAAEAITRTAVTAVSNQAKREYYLENQDIIKSELYVATLDGRTTPICQSLDGKKFPVGKGPIPPLHVQCRSVRVGVIGDEAIGERPARAFTQRQLLREFTTKNKLKSVTTRGSLPRGTKRQFDKFSRSRMRELTGRVPAKVTYQEWLKRQSPSFQDDVLGKTKGKLFRDGGLTLDKFVDRKGQSFNLRTLGQIEKAAFKKAGLSIPGLGASRSTGGAVGLTTNRFSQPSSDFVSKVSIGHKNLPPRVQEALSGRVEIGSSISEGFLDSQPSGTYAYYATNFNRVYYGQQFMGRLTQERISRIVAHESSHFLDANLHRNNGFGDVFRAIRDKATALDRKRFGYFLNDPSEMWAEAGAHVFQPGPTVQGKSGAAFAKLFQPAIDVVRARYKELGLI